MRDGDGAILGVDGDAEVVGDARETALVGVEHRLKADAALLPLVALEIIMEHLILYLKLFSLAYLLPDPAAPGSNHSSGVFFRKISNFALLIYSALLMQWTVKICLKG